MRGVKQERWLRVAGDSVVLKEDKEFAINGKQNDSVREETSAVSGTMAISAQNRHQKTAPPSESPNQRGRSASRKKSLKGWRPSGKFARQPCVQRLIERYVHQSLCDDWHVNCASLNRVVNSARSARLHTARLKVNLAKERPKKDADKSAVAMLRNVRLLGCVFQDAEPPESLSIIRKNSKVLGASRRVQFSKATRPHANIRESTGPSL